MSHSNENPLPQNPSEATEQQDGNDLITPHPEFGFPGLKAGDSWCVCATWYARSIEEGTACPVFLKKTNEKTLQLIPIEKLKKHAIDLS